MEEIGLRTVLIRSAVPGTFFSNWSFFSSGSVTPHKRSVLFNHALPSSSHALYIHNCVTFVDPITEASGLQKSLFQHDYIQLFCLPCPFSLLLPFTITELQCTANWTWHQCSYVCFYIYTYRKPAENTYLYMFIFKNANEEFHCLHTSPCNWLLCLLCSGWSEQGLTQITVDYKYLVWQIIFFKCQKWANLKAFCLHVVWCLALICDCSLR